MFWSSVRIASLLCQNGEHLASCLCRNGENLASWLCRNGENLASWLCRNGEHLASWLCRNGENLASWLCRNGESFVLCLLVNKIWFSRVNPLTRIIAIQIYYCWFAHTLHHSCQRCVIFYQVYCEVDWCLITWTAALSGILYLFLSWPLVFFVFCGSYWAKCRCLWGVVQRFVSHHAVTCEALCRDLWVVEILVRHCADASDAMCRSLWGV